MIGISIGELAKRAATKVETIRFYEQKGLMPEPARTDGGQRRYSSAEAKRLAFIRHAREMGFPIDAIRELLRLIDTPNQSCERIDHIAKDVLTDVEAKIARLQRLREELRRMIKQCTRGLVSQCRIVEVLADHSHSHCLSAHHKL